MTNMRLVCGPGTAFDDENRRALANVAPDTILVVETTSSQTHWMQPGGDLELSKLPAEGDCDSAGISGSCRDGFFVGFADGKIWLLSDRTPLAVLRRFFTAKRSGADSREELLSPYRLPAD